jgi:very-short-patch-repair endonuclease
VGPRSVTGECEPRCIGEPPSRHRAGHVDDAEAIPSLPRGETVSTTRAGSGNILGIMTRAKGWKAVQDDERSEIIRRYVAGETIAALSHEFHRAVKLIIRAAGVARPRGYGKARTSRKTGLWTPEWREAQKRGCNTPAFKEAHRRSLLQRLPTMAGPALNSPIELRMHDALRARGIGFDTHSLMLGRYLVDIEIRQAPIVIEADGAQHRLSGQHAKDVIRDAALSAAGYRVFRFTGSEINRDSAVCVEHVINACGLKPDKEPIYNIRTRMAGPTHPNWAGPDVSHTCVGCGKQFTTRPNRRGRYCGLPCYFARSRS